jgi:shikimate dehydrogenase
VRFALLGDPVAHSKSPAMHAAAYRALGMDHTYEAIRATPEELAQYTDRLRRGEFGGFNVTVPHKEAVLAHVDEIDSSAKSVAAANTLVRLPSGRVIAHNTDVPALDAEVRALANGTSDDVWRRSTAIVLGSGGAARAAIASLARIGVKTISVRARAFADAGARERFSTSIATAAPLDLQSLEGATGGADVRCVIQATSAGMVGKDGGEEIARAIDFASLAQDAVAIDVVYAPPKTPFLAAAENAGLRTANGLGMLARQGALAFELWLGVPAPYDVMLGALR